MNTIETLKQKIAENEAKSSEYREQLKQIYQGKFSDWKQLHDAIVELDSADIYEMNSWRNIEQHHYHDIDLSQLDEIEREALDEYLEEHFEYRIDIHENTISREVDHDGECYLIQNDGVWRGNERIIESSQYESDEYRDYLIEQDKEKQGCFPGVYLLGFGGDIIKPIDTLSGCADWSTKKFEFTLLDVCLSDFFRGSSDETLRAIPVDGSTKVEEFAESLERECDFECDEYVVMFEKALDMFGVKNPDAKKLMFPDLQSREEIEEAENQGENIEQVFAYVTIEDV